MMTPRSAVLFGLMQLVNCSHYYTRLTVCNTNVDTKQKDGKAYLC